MSTQPLKVDGQNRELRERTARNADRCALCAEHDERYRTGWRLWTGLDPNAVKPRSICFPAKHEGSCAQCGDPIRVGQLIWWAKGVDGVECASCNKR